MKLLIGKCFTGVCKNKNDDIAIEIPGVGFFESKDDKNGFKSIVLSKDDLIKLINEIGKELNA